MEDLTPQMAVVEKVFITLHCHIALIGSFGRHIEESAFRLFLLRKLDTYKSNIEDEVFTFYNRFITREVGS